MKTLFISTLLWFVADVKTENGRHQAILVSGTDTSYLYTSKPIVKGDTVNIEDYLITK